MNGTPQNKLNPYVLDSLLSRERMRKEDGERVCACSCVCQRERERERERERGEGGERKSFKLPRFLED